MLLLLYYVPDLRGKKNKTLPKVSLRYFLLPSLFNSVASSPTHVHVKMDLILKFFERISSRLTIEEETFEAKINSFMQQTSKYETDFTRLALQCQGMKDAYFAYLRSTKMRFQVIKPFIFKEDWAWILEYLTFMETTLCSEANKMQKQFFSLGGEIKWRWNEEHFASSSKKSLDSKNFQKDASTTFETVPLELYFHFLDHSLTNMKFQVRKLIKN